MIQNDIQDIIHDITNVTSTLNDIAGIPNELHAKLQKIIKNIDKLKTDHNICTHNKRRITRESKYMSDCVCNLTVIKKVVKL